MQIGELLDRTKDAISTERVFGQPYERNGVTVIPVAKVAGGGGGGGAQRGAGEDQGEGLGAGYGIAGKPIGAYIVRGDHVRFEAVIDRNAIVLRAMALLGLLIWLLLRR